MDEERQVSKNVCRFFRMTRGIHVVTCLFVVACETFKGGFDALQAWYLIFLPLTIAVTAEVEKSAKKDTEQKAG